MFERLSRREVEIKKPVDSDLANLSNLVKDNKFDEIKDIVRRAKAKGWKWKWDDKRYVECAVRDAILLGQIGMVRFFLNEGFLENKRAYGKGNSGKNRSSLISVAAKSGNLAIVKLLVERGADIRPKNDDNGNFHYDGGDDSAIEAAVQAGHADVVDYLLKKGANANGSVIFTIIKEVYGGSVGLCTFLAIAVQDGNFPIVESLLKHGASIQYALTIANQKFQLDLQDAAQKKQELEQNKLKDSYVHLIKTLLDYAVGIYFLDEKDVLRILKEIDISGFNFIGISIEGQPVTCEMLIERGLKGADKALVSINDLENLQDVTRRKALISRWENRTREQGSLINNEGIVNLVPLWLAAEIGDIEAVKTRLAAGVDPNNGISIVCAPIVLAAEAGHADIVKMLAEHPKINRLTIAKAVDGAKSHKHEEIAASLSERHVNAVDEKRNTLLHIAVAHEDIGQVQFLINHGANIHLKNKERATPLCIAASIKNEKGSAIVRILLENYANANRCDIDGYSPLRRAIYAGNSESVALLLPHTEKKVYVDLMFDALDVLCDKNKIEILSLLKEYGADFNDKSRNGNTLLTLAIRPLLGRLCMRSQEDFKKQLKLINFLLDNGADINLGNRNGDTPLYLLIKDHKWQHNEEGYKQALELFVQRGANVNAKTMYFGRTPLYEAANIEDIIVIEFLVSHGAEINAMDIDEQTPLHRAAKNGFAKATELLIKLGADVDAVDGDGLTPLELCKTMRLKNSYRLFFAPAEGEEYLQTQRILSDRSASNKKAINDSRSNLTNGGLRAILYV